MLVTFTTKYHADIIMFGDVGLSMLKMMGLSGTVPSALLAADVPKALTNLKAAVANSKNSETNENNADGEPIIATSKRALPLIELLTVAVNQGSDVTWS